MPTLQDEVESSYYFFMTKAVPLYMYVNNMLLLVTTDSSDNNQHLSVIPRASFNRQIDVLVEIFDQRHQNLTSNYDVRNDNWASLYQFLSVVGSRRQPFMEKIILPQGPPI